MDNDLLEADLYQLLPHQVTAKAADYRGGVTPKHSHIRAQLIYAAIGVMRVETEDGCWVVPPLRGVWIPPNMSHTVFMLSPVEMRTLYIRADIAQRFPVSCCLVEVSPLLRQLILSLTQEPIDYDETGRGGLMAQLALLEIQILKTPALHLPLPSSPKILSICQSMLAAPEERRTLEHYADKCAMSSRTLARKFERETGLSFSQWRQQAILADALGRLADHQPIAKIAADLGYVSPSAFTAMFKRVLGVEPSRYFN